jgi:hypothetical protein
MVAELQEARIQEVLAGVPLAMYRANLQARTTPPEESP